MHSTELSVNDHPVLIFDGVCNLCEWLVIFVVKRDQRARIKFVTAQSEVGQQLQRQNDIDVVSDTTMVLLKNSQVYTRSDAAIEIARDLDGLWKLLSLLAVIPKPLRDSLYGWIGKNRYRWFGIKKRCLLPNKDLKSRFL